MTNWAKALDGGRIAGFFATQIYLAKTSCFGYKFVILSLLSFAAFKLFAMD